MSWEDEQCAILRRASVDGMAPLFRIRAFAFSFDCLASAEDFELNRLPKLEVKDCSVTVCVTAWQILASELVETVPKAIWQAYDEPPERCAVPMLIGRGKG
jgi:hypothetical protein